MFRTCVAGGPVALLCVASSILQSPSAHGQIVVERDVIFPAWQSYEFDYDCAAHPSVPPDGGWREDGSDSPSGNQLRNPWLHWRMTAVLTPPPASDLPSFEVPGFFAGDGTDVGEGTTWRVRFTAPDVPGGWRITAYFEHGTEINVAGASAGALDAEALIFVEDFVVVPPDVAAPGFLGRGFALAFHEPGRLGARYLRTSDGTVFLKGGVGSPENLLAYSGFTDMWFDPGTGLPAESDVVAPGGRTEPFIHRYAEHGALDAFGGHWSSGDLDWSTTDGGDRQGRGIVGAVNYLAEQGVNGVYALPMNLGGDGRDTHPFLGTPKSASNPSGDAPSSSEDVRRHYRYRRMEEWNDVFEHMMHGGIQLQLVLAEQEAANVAWLGPHDSVERRLFHKQLVAMFGHNHAIKWNLCEENRAADPGGFTPQFTVDELTDMAHWIQRWDVCDWDPERQRWIGHPISVHNAVVAGVGWIELYGRIRDEVPDSDWWLDVTSLQVLGDEHSDGSCSSRVGGTVHDYEIVAQQARKLFLQGGAATGGSSSRLVVIDVDEQGSANGGVGDETPGAGALCGTWTAEDRRKRVLYRVMLSGGSLSWYFGYYAATDDEPGSGDRRHGGGDLRTEWFPTREGIYGPTRRLRELLAAEDLFAFESDRRFTGGAPLVIGAAVDPVYGEPNAFFERDATYFVYYPTVVDPSTGAVRAGTLRPGTTTTLAFVGRWRDATTLAPIGDPETVLLDPGESHDPTVSGFVPAPGQDLLYELRAQ